jgi:hypothetical protein
MTYFCIKNEYNCQSYSKYEFKAWVKIGYIFKNISYKYDSNEEIIIKFYIIKLLN